MTEADVATWILLICVGAFTAIAAVSDVCTRRIPNRLTVPVFFAGLLFQFGLRDRFGFNGFDGITDAALAFLVGFGILFALWFVGGGGGGDVKLMGALSVWLGVRHTLYVLVASTVLVLIGTAFVVLYAVARHGIQDDEAEVPGYRTRRKEGAAAP